MHLKNKPPIFVPHEFQAEIEQLSKAALMDMVWDLAGMVSGQSDTPDAVMHQVRYTREIVTRYRKQA